MIRVLVFDFGNVLAFFDHEKAIATLLPHTDRSADEFRRLVYVEDIASRYERGQATSEQVFEVACRAGGLRCTYGQFIEAFCDIFWPNPPMADLIPRLKSAGYRLVLASNTNVAHFDRFRGDFAELLGHFDALGVSHEAGARKPEPAFYEHVHRLTQAAKEECLFIDDVADNVAAARDFGWRAEQFTGFDDLLATLTRNGIRGVPPASA